MRLKKLATMKVLSNVFGMDGRQSAIGTMLPTSHADCLLEAEVQRFIIFLIFSLDKTPKIPKSTTLTTLTTLLATSQVILIFWPVLLPVKR